ncbi:MAG: ATP-binding protein [Oscillospiraceae bacterium]|jgi:hypothetical protein|nr:ATP-binding protein [Oscillospiraceae bacterium]
MRKLQEEKFRLSSLTIYREAAEDPVVRLLTHLLSEQFSDIYEAASDYGAFCDLLARSESRGDLTDYLYRKALYSDNIFTRQAARGQLSELSENVRAAAARDLETLWHAAAITTDELKDNLSRAYPSYGDMISGLPDYDTLPPRQLANWGEDINTFAEFARANGYGEYARYLSFLLAVDKDGGIFLDPVKAPDSIRLRDLKEYERERKIVIDNTLALLDGAKANNILLYGDRGTGKSSTVKAILNEYAGKGLRLIEVSKYNLKYLAPLIELLQDNPLKFIIFTDDLSFTENDSNYTAMKAVLDGSTLKLPDNVVIYATSNRRHMVKETFSGREGDEVHLADTLDEAASLSDRFGITVTFLSPNRKKFNEIVLLLAKDCALETPEEKLLEEANIWAMRKANFSPRCARQFIDHVCSRVARGEDFEWTAGRTEGKKSL